MGRFYKTSRGRLLDYTLKLPEKMMIQTVQYNDQMITKSLAAYDAYAKSLKGQGLGTEDESRLHDIFSNYQDRINSGTNELNKNILEWRNQMPNIKKIGTDIYHDMTQGEWGKIQGNYNTYAQWSKNLDDTFAKNPDKFLPSDLQKLKSYAYLNWKGTDYNKKTGEYNTFQKTNPAEYYDIIKHADLLGKGFKADSNTTYFATPDGKYFREGVNGIKTVSKDEVFSAVYNGIMNDPKAQAYFGQEYKLNTGLGLIDPKAASNYMKNSNNKTLKKLYVPNNDFANYMSLKAYNATIAPIDKYAYVQRTSGVKKISIDPSYLEGIKQRNRIALYKMKQGIGTTISAGVVSKELLDKKDFNPQAVSDSLKQVNKDIISIQQKLADAKSNGDKHQIDLLQDELTSKLSLQSQYSTFNNSSDAYAQSQLAKDGYNMDIINRELPIYNEVEEARKHYVDTHQKPMTANQITSASISGLTGNMFTATGMDSKIDIPDLDMTNKATFQKVMEAQGYSADEIDDKYKNFVDFKSNYKNNYSHIKSEFDQYKKQWYNENANSNKYDAPYVDLSTLQNDPAFTGQIMNFVRNGMGIYVADNLYNPKSSSYETTIKRKNIFNRIFTSPKKFDIVDYEKKEGIDLTKSMTIIGAEPSGNKTLVHFRIDPTKLSKDARSRLVGSEGNRYVITMAFDNRSGVPDFIHNYVTQNYEPSSQLAAQTTSAIGNTQLADVFQMTKMYAGLPYIAPSLGSEPAYYIVHPMTNIKQSVQVKLVNGVKEYNVITYYKNKENKWTPITDKNGNDTFSYEGDNAAMEIGRDVIDMRNKYYNMPAVKVNNWNKVSYK